MRSPLWIVPTILALLLKINWSMVLVIGILCNHIYTSTVISEISPKEESRVAISDYVLSCDRWIWLVGGKQPIFEIDI